MRITLLWEANDRCKFLIEHEIKTNVKRQECMSQKQERTTECPTGAISKFIVVARNTVQHTECHSREQAACGRRQLSARCDLFTVTDGCPSVTHTHGLPFIASAVSTCVDLTDALVSAFRSGHSVCCFFSSLQQSLVVRISQQIVPQSSQPQLYTLVQTCPLLCE